jgi:aminopeptidase-like protein
VLRDEPNDKLGDDAHALAAKLWPINRSLTGEGVRKTLEILKGILPELTVHAVPTGYKAFDWDVPQEWRVQEAYVETPDGKVICDWKTNNLHLVGYSTAVDANVTRAELETNLHSLPAQPTAIPYVTSYYAENWGFCLPDEHRSELVNGTYRVCIDAEHFDGELNYADLVIPGESSEEIVFSTYVCHPSMANNELSGPVVATALAGEISQMKHRKFSYRFIFVPETIGSLVYLSKNLQHLKHNTRAGFVLTCVGDENGFSYMPSRNGGTLADRCALKALRDNAPDFQTYSYRQRGSDERQYCSPGIDLPFCSVMKSKYGCFPEYHTSLDDLSFVTPKGLGDSIAMHLKIIAMLEKNGTPKSRTMGEPQLGKRGLYSNLSYKGSAVDHSLIMDILGYADGTRDLIQLAEFLDADFTRVAEIADLLVRHDLIEIS